MKKYLPIITILTLVPSFAFASWWNPSTWFKQDNVAPQASSSESVPQTSEITPKQTNNPSISNDSQLQAEIDSLTAQNNQLESKLETVQKNYYLCQANLATAQGRTQKSTVIPDTSITKTTSAIISLDSQNPPAGEVTATGGQISSLPILSIDIQPTDQGQSLNSLTVDINATGKGDVTANLYSTDPLTLSGSSISPIATGKLVNGSVTFSNIQTVSPVVQNLSPLRFPASSYNVFTVGINVSGLNDVKQPELVSASFASAKIIDSKGQVIDVTGTAKGKTFTITPLFYSTIKPLQ